LAWLPASAHAAQNPTVEMVIVDRGKVLIELYPRDAPKTVNHFLDLVKRKFYDDMLFYRVVP